MLLLLKELLLILALTALGVAYSLFSGQSPAPWVPAELEAGEIRLVDAQAYQPIWVDARSADDFAASHLDGALSLNEDNWDSAIMELMGTWLEAPRPIVVYCSSESCGTSKRIAARLRDDLPDAEIYSLFGGWQP